MDAAEGTLDESVGSKVKDSLGEEIDLKSLPRGIRKKKDLGRLKGKDLLASASTGGRSSPLKDALDKLQLSVSDLGTVDAELRKEAMGSEEKGDDREDDLLGLLDEDEDEVQEALRIGDLELVKAQGLKHGLSEPLPTGKSSR